MIHFEPQGVNMGGNRQRANREGSADLPGFG